MTRTRLVISLFVVTLLVLGPGALQAIAIEKAIPDRDWRVFAGVMYRSVDNLQIDTGTRANAGWVPAAVSPGSTRGITTAGPVDAISDRRYDDGFVLTDGNTPQDGSTWFWGYDNAAQVQGDNLVFHDTRGMTTALRRDASTVPAQTVDGDEAGWGPFLYATRTLTLIGPVALEAVVGWSYVGVSASGVAQTFSEEQRWTEGARVLTDTYSLNGQVIPPAPYRGEPLLPGPLLSNIPDSRSETTADGRAGRYTARNVVREALDLDLMTFSAGLGGRMLVGGLDLGLSAGPTLNWLHTEADRSETLFGAAAGKPEGVLTSWQDEVEEDDLEPGIFLQVDAGLQVGTRAMLMAFGRFDWIENVSHALGPSRYRVDPDGCSAGVAVGILL